MPGINHFKEILRNFAIILSIEILKMQIYRIIVTGYWSMVTGYWLLVTGELNQPPETSNQKPDALPKSRLY
jgi:hypothetical protein